MVSLLLYAYSLGIRSSRQIERACVVDVGFRVIAANQTPDYTTICRFRKENETELADLFTAVLELCVQAGLVKVGVVALDGTKMNGKTSLAANRTYSGECSKYLSDYFTPQVLGERSPADAARSRGERRAGGCSLREGSSRGRTPQGTGNQRAGGQG